MATSNVSKEELKALLPHIEVSEDILKAGRSRISMRCLAICLILFVRIVVSIFFPEYHLVTITEHKLLDKSTADMVLYLRLIVLVILILPIMLVMSQPDLGTSLLIASSGLVVIWLAGLNIKYFLYSFVSVLISLPFAISVASRACAGHG